MRTRILHISDFHLGCEPEKRDTVDDKEHILQIKTENIIEKFFDILKGMEIRSDFIVFSGDIVHHGEICQYNSLNESLFTVLTGKYRSKLPEKNHIVFVPGNHDTAEANKWMLFTEKMKENFIIPWFDFTMHKDQTIKYLYRELENIDKTGYFYDYELPFIIDFDRHIIIYALNSASLCNEFIDGKKIDCPRVSENELTIFNLAADRIKKKLGNEFDNYLFIVVLHHQITTLPTFEELKSFEIISNAGEIKKCLSEKGVKLVLHGHKHWPEVYFDSAISGGGALTVISGGTICGNSNRKDRECGFFVIEYDSDFSNEINVSYCPINNFVCEADSFIREGRVRLPNKNIKYYQSYHTFSIEEIYIKIEQSILNHMLIHNDEYGWNKCINNKNQNIGFFGTAIAICILSLVGCCEERYINNFNQFKRTLLKFKRSDEGYNHSHYKGSYSSIEGTCWAIRAYKAMNMFKEYKDSINALINIVQEQEIESKNLFQLSLILDVLTEYNKIYSNSIAQNIASNIYKTLLKDSKGIIENKQGYLLNTIDSQKGEVVHIAHAVLACNKYIKSNKDDSSTQEVDKNTINWIYTQVISEDLSSSIKSFNTSDIIENEDDSFEYAHYALPWIFCALLENGYEQTDYNIAKLLEKIISCRDENTGLFKSGTQYTPGFPIWETYDTIIALKAYSKKCVLFL